MILYHGTSTAFSKINLSCSKDKRDFGKGFYTTEQAIQQLSFFKVNDQISFHTKKALTCLNLKEDREV